jgi:hypothetical protein
MNSKIYLTILFILISTATTFAQKLSKIDTLEYSKMVSKTEAKKYSQGMDVNVYLASDKNSYKAGDTLVLGIATGESKTAFSKKRTFAYIFYGRPVAAALTGIRYVEETYSNYKVVIEKIQLSKGTFGLENYIALYAKPLEETKFTMLEKYVTITLFDNALTNKEIKPLHSNRPMTREEAVDFLKKKKEELDLDIITKEEFDKIKEQLIPIIKGG